MEPAHLRFGGGVSHTVFNPFVAAIVLAAGLMILLLPRNKALVAFLVTAILIPTDQILLIGPFHFPVVRILVLLGMIRIVKAKMSSRISILAGGLNGIDIALFCLSIFTAIDGTLLYKESAEFVFQVGMLYTTIGLYVLMRFLVRDDSDVRLVIRVFAYIALAVAALMAYERATGRNLVYSLLGGAASDMYSSALVRNGEFRATGPFGHPILAGTFGSILAPLFIGLWLRYKKDQWIAILGLAASSVISMTAGSSTALLGLIGGVFAICLWPIRDHMRWIRWGIVLCLVSFHIVMRAPVWQLIARVDLSGGSDSDHRYQLINQCILHFWDWYLVGTKDYASWGWHMFDLCDQYVNTADTAGLIPLISLITIIVLGFRYVGKKRRKLGRDRKQELFLWAIGAALFSHTVSFFGISYFDQTIVAWYALLAIIAVLVFVIRPAPVVQRKAPSRTENWDVPVAPGLAQPATAFRAEGE